MFGLHKESLQIPAIFGTLGISYGEVCSSAAILFGLPRVKGKERKEVSKIFRIRGGTDSPIVHSHLLLM